MASPFLDDIESSLVFESERLKTFFEAREDGTCGSVKLWSSVADITPEELAKDGFYFLKKADHCACVFCRGIVGLWEKGDVVRSEHQNHFPRCPFIRGEPVGNIPMSLCEHLEPMWRETLIERLKERNKIPSRIIYSDFSYPGSREASFDSMSLSMNMKKKLSDAGFYNFTDISDHVRCFRCGLGLRDWSENMDPLTMHAKYSPDCIVVKLGSLSATRHDSKKKKVNDTLVDLVIEHGDIERYVTALGFPLDAIKAAVKKRLLERGIKFYRVTECTEAVLVALEQKMRAEMAVARTMAGFAKRDEDRRMGVLNWITNLTTPEPLQVLSDEERHEALGMFLQPPQQPPEPYDEDETSTTQLSEEESPGNLETEANVEEKPVVENECSGDVIDELACKVCLCQEAIVVLFPCKHLCMCPGCAISLGKCPICRRDIDDVLKITRC